MDKDRLYSDIAKFIKVYTKTHQFPPTLKEIAEGVSQPVGSTQMHLITMRNLGLIEWERCQPRTIRVLKAVANG